MTEILEIIISWPVTVCLVWAVLRYDEGRLTAEQLGRAWPPRSRLVATAYFGTLCLTAGALFVILCLPVHFWRTRRSVLGTLEGFAWAAGVTAVVTAVAWGVELSSPLWSLS
jgi:hypothetical protein